MSDFAISVVTEEPASNLTVLRIAAAARNSVTEFYAERVQITLPNLEELNRKILRKLNLHRIQDTTLSIALQLQRDRHCTFSSMQDFLNCDLSVETLTEALSFRWSFVFDSGDGQQPQLHSVFIKISESPSPGLFMQRLFSSRTDDLERPEIEHFAPIVCKLDFTESRFSNELLAIASEWVKAQPKAESTFGFANWLRFRTEALSKFVNSTLPPLLVLGYVGVWLGLVPHEILRCPRVS